jgi:hypothetical protein
VDGVLRRESSPLLFYGVGTVIPIFAAEVVDFGATAEEVRERVAVVEEPVFVAAVPETSPVVEPNDLPNERRIYCRRVLFTYDEWMDHGEIPEWRRTLGRGHLRRQPRASLRRF